MRPSMRRTTFVSLLAAATMTLGGAAPALADTALNEYQRTGQINPCTAADPGSIPNDVAQYAPDFLDALREAQRQGCNKGGVSSTTPTAVQHGIPVAKGGGTLPPGATYVPKPPAPPRVFHDDKNVRHLALASASDVRTPAPMIALGILVLAGLAAAALYALVRRLGWGSGRLGHAFGELGFRLRNLTRGA